MNRAEFMSRLTALLQDVPPAEREEAITYYNEYFDDAGKGNEAGVIASLGSPEELARSIKAGLSDGGNGGEFTESGFHGYEQRVKNQIMSTDQRQGGEQADGAGNAYGAQAGGAGNAYGGPAGGTYGRQTNAGNTYGGYSRQTAGGGNTYDGYGQQAAGQGGSQKKPMTGGQIALIIVLAVLLSPVWIGVLGGLFGGGMGILAGLLGVFVAFLVVGVVLTVVGIALVIAGFVAMIGAPLGGLSLVGGGLIMVAVGLVFVWLMVLVVGKAIPWLFRGCVNLCRRLFHRGGAQA
ncbi:MAG: DUF1700 domain-containing protein [Lachnospiraceae bacterium]|nr:DUF1700 domain-containing protein [Lachnospiraceae bacterium]